MFMGQDEGKLKKTFDDMRRALFPGMTLCVISFSDGTDTNDFIPNEVLNDPLQSAAEWWNERKKNEYLPLMQGKLKAVSATPVKEN
jgi:hypothetical protein